MAKQSLNGKVVVITGASSGFGKGAALELARGRAKLVLAARRNELLDELVRECKAAGGEAVACPTDVSKRDEVEQLATRALTAFGRIDVWVNDAGVGTLGPFERIPIEQHEQVIATNLLGTLYGSYYAYRQFLSQGSGILINIASELGYHSVPYYSSYTASKHGVMGLSDSLRQEVRQKGIDGVHICTIMPTAHDTPFFEHAGNYTGHQPTPPKPVHNPQHVVDAIVRLAQDPEDKRIVGADGVVKLILASVAPPVVEKVGAKHIQNTIDKAPPAGDTPGAVLEPVMEGTEVRRGNKGGRSDAREDPMTSDRPQRKDPGNR